MNVFLLPEIISRRWLDLDHDKLYEPVSLWQWLIRYNRQRSQLDKPFLSGTTACLLSRQFVVWYGILLPGLHKGTVSNMFENPAN